MTPRSLFLAIVITIFVAITLVSVAYAHKKSHKHHEKHQKHQKHHSSHPKSKAAKAGGVYWGTLIQQGGANNQKAPYNWSLVTQFEQVATNGKMISAIHWGLVFYASYCGGYCVFDSPKGFGNAVSNGALPVFDWSTHSYSNQEEFTPAAIASGSQDSYVSQWAQDAAAMGHTMVLVLDWEMNGDWYPFAPKKGTSITAASYVAMWQRIVTIFRSEGAHNVLFAWVPNVDPQGAFAKASGYPLSALYPGDEYVDIVGLDGYNSGGSAWTSFEQLFGPTYDLITQKIAPNKPFMIKEVGSVENGGSKANWISEMFAALPKKFPLIKILLWYDEVSTDSNGNLIDWPLESSQSSADAFASGVADTRFYEGSANNLNAAMSRLLK